MLCEMEARVISPLRNRVPNLLLKSVRQRQRRGAEEFRQELEHAAQRCLGIMDQIIQALIAGMLYSSSTIHVSWLQGPSLPPGAKGHGISSLTSGKSLPFQLARS